MSQSESKRHLQRLAMGAGAILSLYEAAALLPIADKDARRWLKKKGLIRALDGRHVVVWHSVMATIDLECELPTTAPRAREVPGCGKYGQSILAAFVDGENRVQNIYKTLLAGVGGKTDLKITALYPMLHRMERDGLLESREHAAPPGLGGRPRRLYKLTAAGVAARGQAEGARSQSPEGAP